MDNPGNENDANTMLTQIPLLLEQVLLKARELPAMFPLSKRYAEAMPQVDDREYSIGYRCDADGIKKGTLDPDACPPNMGKSDIELIAAEEFFRWIEKDPARIKDVYEHLTKAAAFERTSTPEEQRAYHDLYIM